MDSSILSAFGMRVKALRQTTGLSQEKFALSIGMDRTYYASVESGKRNVSLINIEKIAGGLGVPISDLFTNLTTEENNYDLQPQER